MKHLAVKIEVREFERGWGNRIDDYMVCESIEIANTWKTEFNSKNNLASVPDWYMVAEGEPIAIEISDSQYDYLKTVGKTWLSTLKTK